ncbi:MAG: hypothetical protein ACK417_06060 [Bacteroidia bacterium]
MKIKQLSALVLLLAMGCNTATQTIEVESPSLRLTAEGPLYDGSNTATAAWRINIAEWLGEDIVSTDIVSAKITSIRLKSRNTENFDLLNDVSVQLAGPKVAMKKVGFLNPVPADLGILDLKLAEDQKGLAEFFGLREITLVADLDLKEEFDDDLQFDAQLKLTFEIKAK